MKIGLLNKTKQILNLVIILYIFSIKGYSQVCNLGEYTFNSQDEIDLFIVQKPSCDTLVGDITIQGNDIVSLAGFQNIISIQGSLQVSFNNNLTSLAGLNNIQEINGSLELITNGSLTSITALNSLTSIGGTLRIVSNPLLENLIGFVNLQTIAGSLEIINNPSLISLTVFSNLTLIDGFLVVQGNSELTSLEGLENINPDSISLLTLSQNSNLSNCAFSNFCDYLNSGGTNVFSSNSNGCNSEVEVQNACSQLSLDDNINTKLKVVFSKQDNYLMIYNLKERIHFSVYSIEGKKILSDKEINPTDNLGRISFNYPKGIYFFKAITSNNQSITKKLIKR